jgi:hypothetical protein
MAQQRMIPAVSYYEYFRHSTPGYPGPHASRASRTPKTDLEKFSFARFPRRHAANTGEPRADPALYEPRLRPARATGWPLNLKRRSMREMSGEEDALDLLRPAGILKPQVKQVA